MGNGKVIIEVIKKIKGENKMMEIYGYIAGKKIHFEFEDPLSCYTTLTRTADWIDVVERKGCPENCNLCAWAKSDQLEND